MSNEKTGGYAFPAIGESNTPGGTRYVFNEGMTMLDHFAGLAMQGLLARDSYKTIKEVTIDPVGIANDAWIYAAAMIAERNRLMNEKP